MKNTLNFAVNNGGVLTLEQKTFDGSVTILSNIKTTEITPGDFVMLLNYYRYVKENDIQCDFINPYGKNER